MQLSSGIDLNFGEMMESAKDKMVDCVALDAMDPTLHSVHFRHHWKAKSRKQKLTSLNFHYF